MNWYLKVLHQYTDFKGRARRTEYWMFVLFNLIFGILAMIIDNLLGTTMVVQGTELLYGFFYLVYALFLLVPNLAVSVRRLHDVGKSGWFFLIGFIPFIGGFILLYFFILDSQPGSNKWGANPKE